MNYPVNVLKNASVIDRPFIKKALNYQKTLQGNKFYLKLDAVGIPREIEKEIADNIIIPGYYGRLAPGIGNLAWSIYKMLLREKTIKRHYLLEKNKKDILKDYGYISNRARDNNRSLTIEEIVKKYDLPPSNIYKVILEGAYKFNSIEIKTLMTNPHDKGASKKMIEEIEWVNKNDVIASVSQFIAQERAEDYENTIKSILDNEGIEYFTQQELIKQQEKEHGKIIATPDFLLKSPVFINNRPISWIDAKHSYGMDIPIVRTSLQKQTGKYVDTWGYGALCFSAGFSDSLEIPGVLLLAVPAESHD
jgi:hypothetical protein